MPARQRETSSLHLPIRLRGPPPPTTTHPLHWSQAFQQPGKNHSTFSAEIKASSYPTRTTWTQASQQPDASSWSLDQSAQQIIHWAQNSQQIVRPTQHLPVISKTPNDKYHSHLTSSKLRPPQCTPAPITLHAYCVSTNELSTGHCSLLLPNITQHAAPQNHIGHLIRSQACQQQALASKVQEIFPLVLAGVFTISVGDDDVSHHLRRRRRMRRLSLSALVFRCFRQISHHKTVRMSAFIWMIMLEALMGKTYCSDSQGVFSNGWTRNITAGAVHQAMAQTCLLLASKFRAIFALALATVSVDCVDDDVETQIQRRRRIRRLSS